MEWLDAMRGLTMILVVAYHVAQISFGVSERTSSSGEWLNHNRPNFILEIVTSFSVALVVIGFCLLISHILRISPIFRQYLFGRK